MNFGLSATNAAAVPRAIVLALGFAMPFAASMRAAVVEAWSARYSNVASNSNDKAFHVAVDPAGDVIVAGRSDDGFSGQDMVTIKYSGANGSLLWQQRYDGPAHGHDSVEAMAIDFSGNVIVAGYSDNGTNYDCYTAKYAAANGAVLWQQHYNGPTNGNDMALSVAVDSRGDVAITGYSESRPYNDPDLYTAKYAGGDGLLLWEQRYTGQGVGYENNIAVGVGVDTARNVVVTGWSLGATNYDYYTAKYGAADGTLIWERRSTGGAERGDFPRAMVVDGNGDVVVTGNSAGDGYTAKYAAADGSVLWEQRFPGQAAAVLVDGSNNVVVSGYHSADVYPHHYTVRYAASDGALIWDTHLDALTYGADYLTSLALDASGNVVLTGSASSDGWVFDYHTIKYAAADGHLVWEKKYNGPADGDDHGQAAAVDKRGDVVVTGFVWNGNDYDYHTIKYTAAEGLTLWEQSYNNEGNVDDEPAAVAVDSRGNVAVTGYSFASGNGKDYYTARYAAADGALLWQKRYNGPANGDDEGKAVAVDSAGNIVVTGYSSGSANARDLYTAKYAVADGALLWEKRYSGSDSPYDDAIAVAITADGDVIVSGSSGEAYYTAKYAANDGTLLWDKHLRGPRGVSAFAKAMALDTNGDVIVTGFADMFPGSADYFTVKLRGVDGSLIWQQLYNGPGNYNDVPQALTVGRNGDVGVTGYSSGLFNSDYYTAKYAGADGALLWEHRHSDTPNAYGEARGIAIDRLGNIVVTGLCTTNYEGSDFTDCYTAKYAAADGSLLWDQRYAGIGMDAGQGALFDANDDVVLAGYTENNEGFFDFYTAKYAGSDGTLLWEKRYAARQKGHDLIKSSRGLAIGPNGTIAITGSSDGDAASWAPWEEPSPGIIYDYVTVVYREPLPIVSIDFGAGAAQLRFRGVAGRRYALQRAPAVDGPWITIAILTAPSDLLVHYEDKDRPPAAAFYRTTAE